MKPDVTEVRELSRDEQRDTDGGVTEGGCIDPVIQRMIDILSGVTNP